jgi:hypothetical protein
MSESKNLQTSCQIAAIHLLAAALTSGCANLNERPPREAAAVPQHARTYLYDRFQLSAESARRPEEENFL